MAFHFGSLATWAARIFLAGLFVIGGSQKIIQAFFDPQTADAFGGGEGAMFFGAMSQMEIYWTFKGSARSELRYFC